MAGSLTGGVQLDKLRGILVGRLVERQPRWWSGNLAVLLVDLLRGSLAAGVVGTDLLAGGLVDREPLLTN